ncbi:FkbM family methyltransferase [Coleofasciculus sp. E1-EBD-02]|uniref:FkbM family methyltransferase n=1 Tax=Coleofasciculus sp. E1-EBD-02 TaxID=3068481 RepID=UPI0032F2D3A0
MYKTMIKLIAKELINVYSSIGYPLLPITKHIREALRWYYHQNPLLRHDSRFYLKPALLKLFHRLLVVEHPQDFTIYQDKIKFRSFGSLMSVHGYYVGEIEYHLVQYIVSQICPGFVMLDIGAHHGLYTLIVAYELKMRGWNGVIHSFEPDPRNYKLLEYNICQNELDNYVVIHKEAVTNIESEQTLLIFDQENSGNVLETCSYVYNYKTIETALPQSIKTVSLDSISSQLPKIDLIKMDIQGGEHLALVGAEKIIMRDRPTIVVEAVPKWETTNAVSEFLINHNYEIYGVNAQGKICELSSSDIFVSWDWIGLPVVNL